MVGGWLLLVLVLEWLLLDCYYYVRVADDDIEAWHDVNIKSGGQRLLWLHDGMWKV